MTGVQTCALPILENTEDIVNEAESTVDIFKKYIDQISLSVNKSKLESVMIDLYNQAMSTT